MDTSTAAEVLLKLYELRTEPELRRARAWFAFEFHPTSARDVLATWLGPGHESAPYRMVTSYWDMAASLVIQGAIPADMFHAEVRAKTNYPDYLSSVERVVESMENQEERIAILERYLARQRALAAEGKQRPNLSVRRGDELSPPTL